MNPKTTFIVDYGGKAEVPAGTTTEQAAALLALPGTAQGDRMQVAAFNGHRFEVIHCQVRHTADLADGRYAYFSWSAPDDGEQPHEQSMEIKYPVDSRILPSDVEGAMKAERNAAGTAWLFLPPSDEDAMLDEEDALRAAIVGRFASAIDAAQVKVNEATNATVRARVVAAHSALAQFRDAVIDAALATARTRHIGWLEQRPHEAHIHLLVKNAVDTVIADWQTDRATDYRQISAQVAAVLKGLTKLHAYEWAWERRTRLAAEAKAEAEAESEPEAAGE